MSDLLTALQLNILFATGGNLFGIGTDISFDLVTMFNSVNEFGDTYSAYDTTRKWYGAADLLSADTGPIQFLRDKFKWYIADGLVARSRIETTKEDMVTSNREYCIGGISWLPWDAVVLPTQDKPPKYVRKDESYIVINNAPVYMSPKFNPLRKEVLVMKLQSIFIIGVALLGSRYLFKYLSKKI